MPPPAGQWCWEVGSTNPHAPTVLLYGHYDVQPPEPLDDWITPPFEPTIRDGRLYARGVGDNKGQHFAQILALESLLAVHGRLPCNVIVLLEGEEEVGSPHIADFIRTHRDLLKADLVITSDGPMAENGSPTIEFGVRGIISFELRARGAKRDLHSGNYRRGCAQPFVDVGAFAGYNEECAGRDYHRRVSMTTFNLQRNWSALALPNCRWMRKPSGATLKLTILMRRMIVPISSDCRAGPP